VRTDVEPSKIDSILPRCFILEAVAPGHARIRVAGQEMQALAQKDLKGLPLSVLFDVQSRPVLQDVLARVFQGPAVVELPLRQAGGFMRAPREGRMLILPLLGADGGVNRAIGAVVADAAFGVRPVSIDVTQPLRCDEIGPEDGQSGARPMALRVVGGTGRPAQPARGGLRLVVSNG
jgi:hypothetical protein